jgi:microbial collagenase
LKRPLTLAGVLVLASLGCEDLPNLAPTASFVYSPVAPIVAGETVVSFNASASQDSDGRITSYVWNFGDGTPEVTNAGAATTHVFPVRGCQEAIYTVLLTVTDDTGLSGFASQTVQVLPPGPPQCPP